MSRINVLFHPAAMDEYIASYIWYHERGSHLAAAFEHEIERAVRLIIEAPERWQIYVGKYRRVSKAIPLFIDLCNQGKGYIHFGCCSWT